MQLIKHNIMSCYILVRVPRVNECTLVLLWSTITITASQNSVVSKAEKDSDVSPILPELYKRRLQRILHGDSKDIAEQFFNLSTNTLKLLVAEGTSVEELKEYISRFSIIMGESALTLADVVQSARKVFDVFFILEKQFFITFYKFTILESIIKNLCVDNDKRLRRQLDEYKGQFKIYIRRRVCESSLYYGAEFNPGDTCAPKEGCNLVLITDKSWNPEATLTAVLDLERDIAAIFGIQDFVLGLKRIEQNCLRLYHIIPTCVEHVVLSIKHEQVVKLISCGIAEIYCGGSHIILQMCKCSNPYF